MHIGFFSPAWPPGETSNGIVTYVKIVREELLRLGHRVTLVVAHPGHDPQDDVVEVTADRRSVVSKILGRVFDTVPSGPYGIGRAIADTVVRLHRRDPLDVFEMEESFGWCRAVSDRLDVPAIVKLHGPAFLSLIDGAPETAERRVRIEQEGKALRAAPVVVAPSRSTMAATTARYSLGSTILEAIPNPVFSVGGEFVWRAERCEADRILFVGRFDYRKGGDSVLRSFGRIAESRPRARLTFVGPDTGLRLPTGQLQHIAGFLKEYFSPEIAHRIEYVGTRTANDIRQMRLQAAVTVVTTRWESFGYAVAEAMGQGCPVVGFNVDGVNELIEHGRSGLLAPLDDVEALTECIERVLDDKTFAAELGRNARESIVETCGAEGVVQRMLSLYARAIEQRKRDSRR